MELYSTVRSHETAENYWPCSNLLTFAAIIKHQEHKIVFIPSQIHLSYPFISSLIPQLAKTKLLWCQASQSF